MIEGERSATIRRRLKVASSPRAVKVPQDPDAFQSRLRELGWDIAVHATAGPFFSGAGGPSA
jgi:hypothetical protein